MVSKDWTVRFGGRTFQIARQRGLPPSGAKIVVQEWRDGTIRLLYQDRILAAREVEYAEPRAPRPRRAAASGPSHEAKEDHSWRTGRYLPIDTITDIEQREELARTYLPAPTVAGMPVGLP